MSAKLPDVEDLTQVPEETRTHVIDVELTDEVRTALQAAADKRGVTLEDYLRWQACALPRVFRKRRLLKKTMAQQAAKDDAN